MELLLCLCPELPENRRRIVGTEFLDGLEELADVDIVHLGDFETIRLG